jgi:prolipoprotein diacylglyceryltransferase
MPGLLLLLGLWIGLVVSEKEAQRLGQAAGGGRLTGEAVYNLALAGLAAGLVGARLAYALRYIDAYRADPWGLIALSPATLAPAEGVLAGMLAMLLLGARRGLPWRPTLDALAPAVAILGVALALAHLASGDAFGAPTTVPWRIYLWDDFRHPTQVYELLGALAVLGAWCWQARAAPGRSEAGTGRHMLWVVALSAAARIVVEGFRGDSVLLASGLRAAQVWAWLVLAACLWASSKNYPGFAANSTGGRASG